MRYSVWGDVSVCLLTSEWLYCFTWGKQKGPCLVGPLVDRLSVPD